MTKQEIQNELLIRHQSFIKFITTLSEEDFYFSPPNKWTAGQQLDHICRATSLLPLGLRLPSSVTRLIFGKLKRPATSYNELVRKYLTVLANGGKASGFFIPKRVSVNKRERLIAKLLQNISKISNALENYSEEQLDKKILPHPLLGKLTAREMMYFTLYHVDHHKEKAKQNLQHREIKITGQ